MKKVFSRPLAPHITIYSSQYTSMYSIWHRVTGVTLILTIVFCISLLKAMSYNFFNDILLTLIYINLWAQNIFFLNITCFFLFHMLNGIRHVLWDLGFILSIRSILISTVLIRFIAFFYLFYILLKVLN